MLNKKKIIAVIATGMIVVVCGVLVYVKFINKEPAYDYTSAPETTITEQQEEYSQDKDVYFEPDSEPVFIAEPVIDWEEPPVTTVYNPDADLNDDGHVDKSEWEQWVAAHPEDLNQDLYITEEEQAEFNSSINQENVGQVVEETPPVKENPPVQEKPVDNKPVDNKQPAEVKEDNQVVNNDKSTVDNTPPTNNNNNQGNTKPADKPTPPATNNNGMTQKEIDAAKKMSEEAGDLLDNWADSQGGGTMTKEQAEKGYDWN